MATPKLRSPDQSLPVRWVLGLYEFCASLKLAVVLIFAFAAVLGWATYVESWFGLRGVHFGIYGTWWFTLLGALLGLNIFCAAAIRFPWKRHQTGFVITHIGLLVLLFGCLLSRRGGVDAQMPVVEGAMAATAFEDEQHLLLAIEPRPSTSAAAGAVRPASHANEVQYVEIPFQPGPFNWSDYDFSNLLDFGLAGEETGRVVDVRPKRGILPWALAARHRAGDVLYDRDGVRVEVLDYYADAREVEAPAVKLRLSTPRTPRMGADGKETLGPETWVPVELAVRPLRRASPERPFGIGDRQELGGGQIVFWLAGSTAETAAFRNSSPEGEIGSQGVVVLHAGGEKYSIQVDEKLGQRVPLGKSGLEVELARHYRNASLDEGSTLERMTLRDMPGSDNPAVELVVHGGKEPERLLLFADLPEFNVQAHQAGVYGSYWVDTGELTSQERLQGKGKSRIDVIQGVNQQGPALFYRYWNGRQVVKIDKLPADGKRVDAFKMPIAQLQMYVEEFIPSDRPETKLVPKPFNKDTIAAEANRAARLRVTIDGRSEEFWLSGPPAGLLDMPEGPLAERTVAGKGRVVRVRMPLDQVDIGYRVRLEEFERRLDPGTSQASHYSSRVDLVHRTDDDRVFQRGVLISMNAPIDFAAREPALTPSYRLFQEAFRGPFERGDPVYRLRYPHGNGPDQFYISVLTVNYDPGRGIKYLGCLLIVVGIATMFYMRAYFFKKVPKRAASSATAQARTKNEPRREKTLAR